MIKIKKIVLGFFLLGCLISCKDALKDNSLDRIEITSDKK